MARLQLSGYRPDDLHTWSPRPSKRDHPQRAGRSCHLDRECRSRFQGSPLGHTWCSNRTRSSSRARHVPQGMDRLRPCPSTGVGQVDLGPARRKLVPGSLLFLLARRQCARRNLDRLEARFPVQEAPRSVGFKADAHMEGRRSLLVMGAVNPGLVLVVPPQPIATHSLPSSLDPTDLGASHVGR